MVRSVVSKVMWVGRATVFMVGLSVILALLFGVASTAFAHGGYNGLLHLGHKKSAGAPTTLVGKALELAESTLVLKNQGGGGGSALELLVDPGAAPLKVNPEAGTATNLNADELDGQDSTGFVRRGSHSGGGSLPQELHFYSYLFRTQVIPETIQVGGLRLERRGAFVFRVCANDVVSGERVPYVVYIGSGTTQTRTAGELTSTAPCTGDFTLSAGGDFRVMGKYTQIYGSTPNYFNASAPSGGFHVIGFSRY